MSDGFTILVTWPQTNGTKHRQETWYAHVSGQADAVRAVQEACGALSDAKVEILGALLHCSLLEAGVAEGGVRKQRDLQ